MFERRPETFGQLYLNVPSYGGSRRRAIVEGSTNGQSAPIEQSSTAESAQPSTLGGHIKSRRAARDSQQRGHVPKQWQGRHAK